MVNTRMTSHLKTISSCGRLEDPYTYKYFRIEIFYLTWHQIFTQPKPVQLTISYTTPLLIENVTTRQNVRLQRIHLPQLPQQHRLVPSHRRPRRNNCTAFPPPT